MGGCSAAFDKEVTVLLLPYPAPGFVLKTRKLYPGQSQIGCPGRKIHKFPAEVQHLFERVNGLVVGCDGNQAGFYFFIFSGTYRFENSLIPDFHTRRVRHPAPDDVEPDIFAGYP